MKAPKVKAPKLKAPKLKAPKLKAPKVKAPKMNAPKVKAPNVKVDKKPILINESQNKIVEKSTTTSDTNTSPKYSKTIPKTGKFYSIIH